jgi:hypothetical protein
MAACSHSRVDESQKVLIWDTRDDFLAASEHPYHDEKPRLIASLFVERKMGLSQSSKE